jgi:hypothetical protein
VKINLATIARYFFIGIDTGICAEDEVQAWAFAVIGALDFPPPEIIEVSWDKPLLYLREDLKAVAGNADLELVSGWLLGAIRANSPADANVSPLVRAAMHVVNATGVSPSLVYHLELVENELELAELGLNGTVADARASLDELLANFNPPPFQHGWSDISFEVQG